MTVEHIILLAVLFAMSLFVVIKMFVKRRLREVYIVTWVVVTCAIPSIVIFYPSIQQISKFLKIGSPFNLIVVIGFIGVYLLFLHFSIIYSTHQMRLKNAIQQLAILEDEINQIKKNAE